MSQDQNKLIIRLPDGMRDLIKQKAAENERTMNAEVVYHLRRAYDAQNGKSGTPA